MIEIKQSVNLSNYTTLKVGGIAEFLVVVSTKRELIEALNYTYENKIKFVILGAGSNILISDSGFHGLVIVNRSSTWILDGTNIIADSGVNLNKLSTETLKMGLLGLEFMAGIPGTIGAAVAGNVGVPLGHISDVFVSAEVWEKGKLSVLDKKQLNFEYRTSLIKKIPNSVVCSVIINLKPGDTQKAQEIIRVDNKRRLASYRGLTAGSYFKNPDGDKTAGELIDSLGLKGYRVGGAEVSTDHANVFRNLGDATANDFYELEKYVVGMVQDKYDINLIPEVSKLGKF